MIIFALDCAKKTAGVAISSGGNLLYEDCTEKTGTHSETLLEMCNEALSKTKITPADIDLFAVTAGPGSFTGLRIGISIIKGLAFSRDAICAGVSTLEALAMSTADNAVKPNEAHTGGVVIASALDARRNHVYGALFHYYNSKLTRLTDDDIMPAETFCELAQQKKSELNCNNKVLLAGDGAPLLANSELFDVCGEEIINGKPNAICKCAVLMHSEGKCTKASKLAPIYLRPTLAERSLQK